MRRHGQVESVLGVWWQWCRKRNAKARKGIQLNCGGRRELIRQTDSGKFELTLAVVGRLPTFQELATDDAARAVGVPRARNNFSLNLVQIRRTSLIFESALSLGAPVAPRDEARRPAIVERRAQRREAERRRRRAAATGRSSSHRFVGGVGALLLLAVALHATLLTAAAREACLAQQFAECK